MVCGRCNYFSFWAIFCPFTPHTCPKNENFKITKKHQEISSFCTSVLKILIIWYTVPEIWHVTDVIVIFYFGLFFALLPPLTAQKSNFQKIEKKKKQLEISSFYTWVPKIMIRWCTVPEIWCVTDGQTDGQKKWHRGGCPTQKMNQHKNK